MKKGLFALIILLISFSLFAQYTVTAQDASGNCGDGDVVVSILINDTNGMSAFQFDLYYDPTLIDAQSVNGTPLTSGFSVMGNTGFADHVRVAAAGTPLGAGSGAICEIHFSVDAAAPDGSSSVLDLQNILVNDIPSTEVDGTFSIACACTSAPGSFNLLSPADGDTGQNTSLTLDWEDAGTSPNQATSYDVYFGTSASPPLYQSNVAVSQLAVSGLSLDTTYHWKVVAKNACGSASSATWSFTTTACTAAPGAFNNLSPADGSTGVSPASVVLDWEDASQVADYDLYFGTSSPPPLYQGGITGSAFTVTNLTPSTTYTWSVIANNPCGTTQGAEWSFATAPPTISVQSISGNCGTQVNVPVLLDSAEGLVSFEFDLVYDPTYLSVTAVDATSITSGFSITTNDTGGRLSVAAASGTPATGSGAICTITFDISSGVPASGASSPLDLQNTLLNDNPPAAEVDGTLTMTCCDPPQSFSYTAPANGATDVPLPVTLQWQTSTNATSYDVYLGTSSSNKQKIATTTGTSYTVENLSEGTTYHWLIQATNACGFKNGPEWTFTTQGTPPPTTGNIFISAVARAGGAHGANWKSDAMAFNPNDESACYDIYLVPAGQSGEGIASCEHRCLNSDESYFYPDILFSACGITEDTAGNLRIEGDHPLLFTSRTYNDQPEGTYGQFIPGATADEAVGNRTLRAGEGGYILGTTNNEDFRTNLGFTEVTGAATMVHVTAYSPGNQVIGSTDLNVPAYGWSQVSWTTLGFGTAVDAYATVEVTSGGAVLAYASVVDNATADATYIPALKADTVTNATHQLIAVATHAPGAQGTQWRTDAWLLNTTTSTKSVTLQYVTGSGAWTSQVSVQPGHQEALNDVIAGHFSDAGESSVGSIHLTNAPGILAVSRTYNQTDEGTYGQFIPARTSDALLAAGQTGTILQLACNDDYRTNIGFTEYSGEHAEVQVTLYDINSSLPLGVKTYTIPSKQNLQVNNIFNDMGIACSYDAAYATVQILSGDKVYIYASVVDNRTGDAVFIPAQ